MGQDQGRRRDVGIASVTDPACGGEARESRPFLWKLVGQQQVEPVRTGQRAADDDAVTQVGDIGGGEGHEAHEHVQRHQAHQR
jgi:hypothetical protein